MYKAGRKTKKDKRRGKEREDKLKVRGKTAEELCTLASV